MILDRLIDRAVSPMINALPIIAIVPKDNKSPVRVVSGRPNLLVGDIRSK
jgi:hypothetical protein